MIEAIRPIACALVVPGETVLVGAQLCETLEQAILWQAEGFTDQSRRWLSQAEDAMANSLRVRARIAEAAAARKASIAVGPPQLPTAERGRAAPQIARFDKLRRKLDLKTLSDEQRQATAEEMGKIERSTRDFADKQATQAHVEGLAALEALREGEVTHDRAGRPRVARDGLKTLAESGAINTTQWRAGLAYRKLFEEVAEEARVTAAYGDNAGGSAGAFNPDAEAKRQRARVKSQWELKALDLLVSSTARNGRGLTALRLVAGQARSIASFGGSGGSRRLYTEALILALDTLADNWGLQ